MEPGVRKLKEILFDLYGEINLQLLEADTVKETPVQVTMFNIDNEYLAKYSKINEKEDTWTTGGGYYKWFVGKFAG